MAIIKKNEILSPFLGAKLNFIPGQDPMGMLNIGEQIFSMLLPGLNNVTARIRYYSFYCWFFGWYAQHVGSEDPKEQRKYIRRAEYLLALLAAKNGISGIAGITEAEKNYNDKTENFSLLDGTGELKGTTEETYWKNPRGVFGQNYVSSLRQMGLIRDKGDDTGLYIRTAFDKENVVTGKDLEIAFEENLSSNTKEIFSRALLLGSVSQKELTLLTSEFDMIKVPMGTSENKLLLKMLMGVDQPTVEFESYFRKTTTSLYLNLLHERNEFVSVQNFVNHAYLQQGKSQNVQDDTLFAWYYYQLSQYWHIVSTSCLKHLLVALQQKSDSGWYVETDLVNEITEDVVKNLINENFILEKSSFSDLAVIKEDNTQIVPKIHTNNYVTGFSYAFLLLKKLMNDNNQVIQEQLNFAKKYNLHSSSDFVAVYRDLEEKGKLPVSDFVSYFIRKYILNRHQMVALNKMNATQSTEKFLREDGFIRLIDFIDFDFSNPRLGNLISFLKNLNIITDEGNELTPSGTLLQKDLLL